MITFVSLLKNAARNIVLVAIMVFNLLSANLVDAQQTMRLGNLRFVLPNASATTASRTIRMKIPSAGLSSLSYYIVGGIAFGQQAVPSFTVQDLDIYYSTSERKAHLVINGNNIVIPLEMFELQPIVNFSNSDDEVLVTLYGSMYGVMNNSESEEIIFHPAFIDNIMGLRLLQVDALTMLDGRNGEFPIFEENDYCLTDSERKKYNLLNKLFKAKGSSYEDNAQKAYQEISSMITNVSSYIYTDIDQPINFSILDCKVEFSGLPYYQFSKVVENEFDKLTYYYSCRYFCYNYEEIVQEMVDSYIEVMKDDFSKSQMDSLREIIVPTLNEYYRAVSDEFMSIEKQKNKTDEQKANELMKRFDESENQFLVQLLLTQMSQIIPKQVSDTEITNRLKAKPELIRQLNPIVYQEVDDICQWSALFRYVKTKNPTAWNTFVSQINKVKPNAPSVKTPIRIIQ